MSNHLAIATVTATLRQILQAAVSADVVGTTTSILPPDDKALDNKAPRLNLFLFQVTPSAAWRNQDTPTRRPDGSLMVRTQLGLELHYLITAYGRATETDPEVHRVLGSALRTLHERPVLTREALRAVTAQPALATSDLAEQIEMIKLSPVAMSIEELSKLWTSFAQTPYRISVAYQASVVLLDGQDTPRPTLPVRDRNIYVFPFRQPLIDALEPQIVEATVGATLTIRGRNLRSDITLVRFGEIEAVPSAITDTTLTVTVPSGVKAGVNPVQVVQGLALGTPPAPHRGVESNVAAFVFAPRITTPEPISVARGGTLTLGCTPAVARAQRVTLLLGDRAIDIPARAVGAPPATSVAFPIPATFPVGSYLTRLRVDGAESVLRVNADPLNPTYVGPLVQVT